MKKRIWLADLTHTGRGTHASTFPLGLAFVASYAKKFLPDDFEIRIFKFPQKLSEAIVDNPPDILCISNYSWNFELGYKFSGLAKQVNPKLMVIAGGPNYPVLLSERVQFLKKRPVIDFYIQNEGEIGFVELVKKMKEYDFDVERLKKSRELITNCQYLVGDELIEGPFQRILDLSIIPSPYLSGVLDEFFEMPLSPMLESTRGCPFSCSFCADGIISKSKVVRFEHERTKKELIYISERIKNVDELIITDLNFGMYKEDSITANYIAEIQKKYNWPITILASAGKNNKTQIIEVANILKGSWSIGASIQSADPEVLKNIKRSNISLDAYREFLEISNNLSKDSSTFTEIILALPGDTKEKHFKSLRYGIENGAKTIRVFQAILLQGTEMASQETRRQHGLITRFRIIPGGVGIYEFGDQKVPVAEIEEIIVGSSDMPFEDYVSCRVMNLLIQIYYNDSIFDEFFSALRTMNVSVVDCLVYIHEHKELYTPRMKEIIDRFIKATTEDLFKSHEEAQEYVLSPTVVDKYISGELGINELLVYRTQLYMEIESTSSVLLMALKGYLMEKKLLTENVKKYFEQLMEFTLCKKKNFHQYQEEIHKMFNYDFVAIDDMKYCVDPRNIEPTSQKFGVKFFHSDNQKQHIQNGLNLYMNTPSGIGRLIHRSNLKTMYRKFEPFRSEVIGLATAEIRN